MRVLVLAPYTADTAPGQRYRIEQWMPYLEREGVQFEVDAFASRALQAVLYERGRFLRKAVLLVRDYMRRLLVALRRGRYDVVFLFREASLIGPAWIERLVRHTGVPIVYDFDDAIFLPYESPTNGYLSYLKFPTKTATICRLAAHVIVGNEYLREYALRFTDRVSVVPTTIDTAKYSLRCRYDASEQVIGWTGSHSSVQYLQVLRPVFETMAQREKFQLLVIGVPGFNWPNLNVRATPWRSATEAADLVAATIGVMPLPDDPWSRGKCACKALQYMGLGIPTIASPVGVNRTIIQDGENGFLAESPDEWVAKITRLLGDEGLRRRLGKAGLETVETEYSASAQAPRVLRILEDSVRTAARRSTPRAVVG